MSTCGTVGVSAGIATPQITLSLPCGISFTLPSISLFFAFSFELPNFSLSFFLSLFLDLSFCDLSLAFDLNGGAGVALCGGRTLTLVPDPGLSEQTYAVAA